MSGYIWVDIAIVVVTALLYGVQLRGNRRDIRRAEESLRELRRAKRKAGVTA